MIKTTFKAILIDVVNREVKEVTISKNFEDINKLIGSRTFTTAFHLPKHDICFVDDEGLLNGPNYFFTFEGAHQPFAGNGLIVGGTSGGNTADAKIDINEVRKNVRFLSNYDVMRMI